MLMLTLFLTGLIAGTVDAIAGGGGLISVPMLFFVGLPPHLVFGTNKLQGALGNLMATRRFWRAGLIASREVRLGVFTGLLGAICGATGNQLLSPDLLKMIAPIMLCAIFIYTLFTPRLGHQDMHARMTSRLFYLSFGFLIAFYDGFFGPGSGSFWVFSLMFCLGYNLIKATAYTKLFNLNSSVIAVVCFALGGNIDYRVAIVMGAGQIIGGQLGAILAIKKGAVLVRPLFLTMVFCTIATFAIRSYGEAFMRFIQFDAHKAAYVPILAVMVCSIAIWFIRKLQSEQHTV